jgi:hypothetical protein
MAIILALDLGKFKTVASWRASSYTIPYVLCSSRRFANHQRKDTCLCSARNFASSADTETTASVRPAIPVKAALSRGFVHGRIA